MRRCLALAPLLALLAPNVGRADDITALYPDASMFAFSVNVKGITTSPFGKKVIGNDKPFDATRKFLKLLIPTEGFRITEGSLKPLETVANKLERVTVAGNIEGGAQPPIAIFLEGEIDEDEYVKALEGYAKAEERPFKTEKLGERKLLITGDANLTTYGFRVSKSLFVVVTERNLVEDVLEKHTGKRTAKIQPELLEWQKKAKPAETPIWFALGKVKVLDGIEGGVATIALKDDADIRIEVVFAKEKDADLVRGVLDSAVDSLERGQTTQAKVWGAAGVKVKQDGTIVTATGRIPGKLLAEEYAKQK